jgi:hypothetical protein
LTVTTDVLTAIGSVTQAAASIAALTLIPIAWISLRNEWRKDRRASYHHLKLNTLKIITDWAQSRTRHQQLVQKIIASLSPTGIDALVGLAERAVVVPHSAHDEVHYMFQSGVETAGDEGLRLSKMNAFALRQDGYKYLNDVEQILGYWSLGVVDREVFECEMAYLRTEDKLLTQFRARAGNANWPKISEFDQVQVRPTLSPAPKLPLSENSSLEGRVPR